MNQLITRQEVVMMFPKRPRDSHKGMFGTVAVLGGANGMIGAPLLAARAALKLGAGCVHVGLLGNNAPGVDVLQPELMLHTAFDALHLRQVDVFAVGCGLGNSIPAQKLLYEVLKHDAAVVVDADALNLIASHDDLQLDVLSRRSGTVLTPHPGEAARLLGCTTADIQADRVSALKKLGERFKCSAVLKGSDTLCITNDGRIFMNTTGNPGMSSPGMGDVLTGMISAFIAQGLMADDAMLASVHLHGAAGDALSEQNACIGMTATEVTEWARWLLNHWK